MAKNEISEEVTTTPLIRDLEKLANRGLNGVKLLVVFLFTRIQLFIAFCFQYFLVFLIVALIGGALGFFSTAIFPRKYASSMELKLNVDAKEQLKNDILYLNALMHLEDKTTIANLLSISIDEAQALKGINLNASSNLVEKTIALNDIHETLDSSLYKELMKVNLVAENNTALSSKFRITLIATQQMLFEKVEKPLLAYLERVPELKELLKTRQEEINYQKEIFESEMNKLDTFDLVMNRALLAQAQNGLANGGDTYVSFDNENTKSSGINTLDLQDRKIFYAQKISKLNLALTENKTCYFISSHLNNVGEKIGNGPLMRAVLTAFFLFAFAYLFLSFRVRARNKAV